MRWRIADAETALGASTMPRRTAKAPPCTGAVTRVAGRATGFLERAVALDPTAAEARYELGRLALDAGNPKDALPHLEAAAKRKPQSSKIHFALSRAYRELDRPEDAARELAAFEKARKAEKNVVEVPQ